MYFSSSRRRFLAASALAVSVPSFLAASDSPSVPVSGSSATFSLNGNTARFFIPGLEKPSKILHITDTHLFMDDERGNDFIQYSTRMAGAYHTVRHFETGNPTTPCEAFEAALQVARNQKVDAVALTGDLISFPSEAGRDWALEKLNALKNETGIPFYYTAGNHDWHYEGWPGTDAAQRDEWIPKRLSAFYPQGADPLCYRVEIAGIHHLFIDDSIYEILPHQLEFLRKELSIGVPCVVWMHIPPYAPGRSVGYGCGNPNWGAKNDPSWKIERRERWAEKHTEVSMEFYRLLCTAPTLLGTACGHEHVFTLDLVQGKPFIVTALNASGGYRIVEFAVNG